MDSISTVAIARRQHQTWYADFAGLDGTVEQRLLMSKSVIDLVSGEVVTQNISSDVKELHKMRQTFGIAPGEFLAKLYHCIPGSATYPSVLHYGESALANSSPANDPLVEASWCSRGLNTYQQVRLCALIVESLGMPGCHGSDHGHWAARCWWCC